MQSATHKNTQGNRQAIRSAKPLSLPQTPTSKDEISPSERDNLRRLKQSRSRDARESVASERIQGNGLLRTGRSSKKQRLTDALRNYSYKFYYTIIVLELGKASFSILEFIPVIGYAFMLVVSLCVAASNAILLFLANLSDPLKAKSRHVTLQLVTASAGILSAILPIIDAIIPFTLFNAIIVWRVVRRTHKKKLAQLENKSSRSGRGMLRGLARTGRRAFLRV